MALPAVSTGANVHTPRGDHVLADENARTHDNPHVEGDASRETPHATTHDVRGHGAASFTHLFGDTFLHNNVAAQIVPAAHTAAAANAKTSIVERQAGDREPPRRSGGGGVQVSTIPGSAEKRAAAAANHSGGSWFDSAIGLVTGPAKSLVNGVVDSVKDAGNAVIGAAKDIATGVGEMTAGFLGNVIEGNFSEALDSLVRGADRAIFQSSERLVSGVLHSAQSLTNGVTDLLGPVGTPLRWVNDRAFDLAQNGLDTGVGLMRDAFRFLPDLGNGIFRDTGQVVSLALQGKWQAASDQFAESARNAEKNLIGGAIDMGARLGQSMGSAALTAVGQEPPARGLTPAERSYLESIYGDSIDYDMIRIKQGGPLTDRMPASHTVGNTIYLQSSEFDANGNLTAAGLETLSHEAAHVWQNQNGGGDYLHSALIPQAFAEANGRDRGEAYDWRQALSEGVPFESMNAEQRAKVVEDLARALANDHDITAADGYGIHGNYSPAEIAFMREVQQKIQSGEGAG